MVEINKYLTKKLDKCWHDYRPIGFGKYGCLNCGYENSDKLRISFNSWEGFGILWEWSNQQDWYEDFLYERIKVSKITKNILRYQISSITGMIDPKHYAIAIYNYLKENEK